MGIWISRLLILIPDISILALGLGLQITIELELGDNTSVDTTADIAVGIGIRLLLLLLNNLMESGRIIIILPVVLCLMVIMRTVLMR